MTALTTFNFPDTGRDLRSVLIDSEPWFIAIDVCAALDITQPASSLRLLDDDEKGVHSVHTPGGMQLLATVNEPGLYSLILRSRKKEAKRFKRWITHEVLPSIRKTGGYGTAMQAPPALSPRQLAEMVIAEADRADKATAALAVAAPKADAWDVFASTAGDFSVTQTAQILSRSPHITIGRDRLYAVLHAWGWIYRYDQHGRTGRWTAKQAQVDLGRLRMKAMDRPLPDGGSASAPPQVRVTPKGGTDILRRLIQAEAQIAIGGAA